jgi:cell division protein FtsZ
MRISVVATGIDIETMAHPKPLEQMQKAAPAIAVRPASLARPVAAPVPVHASAMPEAETEIEPALPPAPVHATAAAPRIETIEAQALGRGGFAAKRAVEPVMVRPAVSAKPAVAPNPFADAAMENGGRQAAKAKARAPSLFERVTNAGRLIHQQDEAPAVDVRPVEPQIARAPEPQVEPAAAQPAPQPAARPERPARAKEEDLLEIPAFLRRQAN